MTKLQRAKLIAVVEALTIYRDAFGHVNAEAAEYFAKILNKLDEVMIDDKNNG